MPGSGAPAEEAAMSYLGYVMNALLNEDVKAEERREERRRRRRREQARLVRAADAAERTTRSSDKVVRPTRAAKLEA
jgi:hypothetical protein